MSDEEGFTLAEVLVALAILGICAVALVGAMGNLVLSSSVHRGFSGVDTLTRAYIEEAERLGQNSTWSCSTDLTPSTDTSGYAVTATWQWIDPSSGASTDCTTYAKARCPQESAPYPAECTPGVQKLTLAVELIGGSGHTSVRSDTTALIRRSNG